MFIIVVGAGRVGRYLISDFLKKKYKVILVEQSKERAEKVSNKYNIEVINGNGTEKEVLESAGIEECDAVLAVTENDQDNLVICQMAERQYNIPQTFTRVNTPGNEKLFNWLGVNVAISSASILSAMVDNDVTINDLSMLLNKDQDKLKLVRLLVPEKSFVINKKLNEIDLPLESVLVTIIRENNSLVPRGNTKILANDLLIALTRPEVREELIQIFENNKE